jgi:lysozyme family protein
MFDIDKFIADQIIKEGGAKFTNDPLDRGGATKYGVTEVAARAWGYAGKMEDLDYHTAFCILKERYWYAPHFDQVDNLSPVLSGRKAAAKSASTWALTGRAASSSAP